MSLGFVCCEPTIVECIKIDIIGGFVLSNVMSSLENVVIEIYEGKTGMYNCSSPHHKFTMV